MVSSTKKRVKSSIEVKLMTVKRKKKSTLMGGRAVTVAFSLCLLAVVAMIGMYTVGKSEQKETKEKEDSKEAVKEDTVTYGAELESDFQSEQAEIAENIVINEMEEASGTDVMTEQPTLSFSADTDKLFWPIAGNIILDFSMDKSVYFSTLDQYKYNPAVIIQGTLDASVMCAAQGKVTSVETLEETGTTVTMDIGDGYELVYGQLKELTVGEGDYLKAGETLGYISEPTKYYSNEGANLYFEVRKDGESLDPMPLLQ